MFLNFCSAPNCHSAYANGITFLTWQCAHKNLFVCFRSYMTSWNRKWHNIFTPHDRPFSWPTFYMAITFKLIRLFLPSAYIFAFSCFLCYAMFPVSDKMFAEAPNELSFSQLWNYYRYEDKHMQIELCDLFFFLLWYLCRWKIDIVFPIQHLHRRGGVWRGWEQTSFSLGNFGFHWNYSQRMEIVLILFFCKLQLNQPFWGTRKVVGWEKLFMERIFLFWEHR